MLNEQELSKIGIYQHGCISTSEIVFSNEVRTMCEANTCRLYGTTWACPPAVGSVEQCKEKCLSYETAMVFSSKYFIEDSYDYEGMTIGHGEFKKVCDRLYNLARIEFSDFLLLSNEGCFKCEKCTYPDDECRFPEMLFPSLEGFGIYVDKTADAAKVQYMSGKNSVTYFGLLLF